METDPESSQKRKSAADNEPDNAISVIKKIKYESVSISDFSDCVLVNILKYLDTTSLYQFGRTCTRFQRLVKDPQFWRYVDARRAPHSNNKASFIINNVGSHTKHLLLAGTKRSDRVIPLSKIVSPTLCANIAVLALENQFLDGRRVKLRDFPNSLQELSFRRSFITDYRRFFSMSSEAMSNLRVLTLDHCQWVETDMVLSLSKFASLEILSLYMCKKVGDHNIVYLSIIGRFGFKSLKVLDARFTGLGSECINSFYRSKTIQEIYFQSYCNTYHDERKMRKKEVQSCKRSSPDDVSYLSDDEDNNDICLTNIRRRFGGNNLSTYKIDTLTDKSVYFFLRTESVKCEKYERPKSVLYKYPYSECTCGFVSNSSKIRAYGDTSRTAPVRYPSRPNQDSIYLLQIDPIAYNRFRKYSEIDLPDYLQEESNSETKDRRWIGLRDPKNEYEIALIEHTDYQVDSYAIASHFLDLNSTDFTNSMAVMASLNQDLARRRIHVIRTNGGRLDFSPQEDVIFNINPTDKILSFSTELLVYCARLLYLVHDEYYINKIRYVIDEMVGRIYRKKNVFEDESLMTTLQKNVHEISKNVSCETRKMLRAFIIGVTLLQNIDELYRYTICELVLRASEKVIGDCTVVLVNCLRKKCDHFRSNIPYDHGIYVNEIPESYSDKYWNFKVIDNDVCYFLETPKCQCNLRDCKYYKQFDTVVIYDGRDSKAKEEPTGVVGFGRKEIPFYNRSHVYWRYGCTSECTHPPPFCFPNLMRMQQRNREDRRSPPNEWQNENLEDPREPVEMPILPLVNRPEAHNLNMQVDEVIPVDGRINNIFIFDQNNPSVQIRINRIDVGANHDPQNDQNRDDRDNDQNRQNQNVNENPQNPNQNEENQNNRNIENEINHLFGGIEELLPGNARENRDVIDDVPPMLLQDPPAPPPPNPERFHLNPAINHIIEIGPMGARILEQDEIRHINAEIGLRNVRQNVDGNNAREGDDAQQDGRDSPPPPPPPPPHPPNADNDANGVDERMNRFNNMLEWYRHYRVPIVENPQNERRFEIALKKLSLRGFPQITDRSLKLIGHLELDLLDVTKTSVTAEGVKEYMLLHPNCRIVHETACTCRPSLHF